MPAPTMMKASTEAISSKELPDHDVAGYQVDNNLDTDWLVRLYDEHGRHDLALRGQRTVFNEQGQPAISELPEAAGKPWS